MCIWSENFGPKRYGNPSRTPTRNLPTSEGAEVVAPAQPGREASPRFSSPHEVNHELNDSIADGEALETPSAEPRPPGHRLHRETLCTLDRASTSGEATEVPAAPHPETHHRETLWVDNLPPQGEIVRENTDRVTLTLPDRPRRSPFDRYRHTAEEAPRPNPNRFLLQRMGISQAELDSRLEDEVDEILLAFRAERRLESLTAPEGLNRILTRDDAWTLFSATRVPTSGSLVGVYWWAVGLSTARFNFDLGWTPEEIALLDAYD